MPVRLTALGVERIVLHEAVVLRSRCYSVCIYGRTKGFRKSSPALVCLR